MCHVHPARTGLNMLALIFYGIAIVCLAAALLSGAPANRYLCVFAIVLALIGLISATAGHPRIAIGLSDAPPMRAHPHTDPSSSVHMPTVHAPRIAALASSRRHAS